MLATGLLVVAACGGDDSAAPPSSGPAAATTRPAPTTSEPPDCDGRAEDYLDTFFALGAGTPRDPEATTVRLPVGALAAIEDRAAEAGCGDFLDVVCSAHAELDAQGLRPVNAEAPARCHPPRSGP